MASNENSSGNPPKGLGQPLVTVSNVHSSGIRPLTGGIATATTPAGSDHPLANISAPPPPAVAPTQSLTGIAAPPSRHVDPLTPAAIGVPSPVPVASPAVTTAPLTSFPSPIPSTKPASPQKKSLDALADAFMAGPSYRLAELKLPPLLKPPPLPPQETGIARLRTLVERRAWGDVLQVSGDMLRSASSPHAAIYASLVENQHPEEPPSSEDSVLQQETVEILTLECHAWLKLRRYVDLGREVERWAFCRINDITAVHPKWVPWSLQILAVESLQYTDAASVQRCIDELYALRDLVQEEDTKYVLTIDSALSNIFLRQKDWRMALESLDHMLEVMLQVYDGDMLHGHKVEVWSRQGRILLQVGAILQAGQVFEKIMPPLVATERSWVAVKIPIQLALHQGMVHFARKDYVASMTSFKQSSDLLRNLPEAIHSYRKEAYVGSSVWVESPQSLLTQAWNNMGLSALYTCRMKEAVRLMESLVREDPTAYLTERLAFNLCTLYELGADTATSARKKRVLQLVAKRFYLHDIGPEQFRVS
eukprot:CAMPEP_0119003982 /NCGR_PEP_ID=MMETSP1176-20130426/879_1 /TAXON_ID=265551 /ORGANISM="Synedropsis recta cf, Strain CCMP1620" /LENGTH=535 /DNA_ID=CAMNT_0006955633 /DNA_START=13 /DNA_END=1620 /DNA_ORIENTATION=+